MIVILEWLILVMLVIGAGAGVAAVINYWLTLFMLKSIVWFVAMCGIFWATNSLVHYFFYWKKN